MPAPLKPYGIAYPITHGSQGYFNQTFTILDQVKTNMQMLLQTKKGERRMNPNFGSGLWAVLFENYGDDMTPIIDSAIRKDITAWMPYVNVQSVTAVTNPSNENELMCLCYLPSRPLEYLPHKL